MDWLLLTALVITGLALIVVEILFVPGTTIVGLLGFACTITAIFGAYNLFGSPAGNYFLVGSVVTFSVVIYLSFRSNLWMKFANKKAITSKVNEGMLESMLEGMEGVTVSDLKPVGNAEFNKKVMEVVSSGNLIETGQPIKIIKIKDNRIFVAPLNT
jgi:membrane-bound ClpP family serine protease